MTVSGSPDQPVYRLVKPDLLTKTRIPAQAASSRSSSPGRKHINPHIDLSQGRGVGLKEWREIIIACVVFVAVIAILNQVLTAASHSPHDGASGLPARLPEMTTHPGAPGGSSDDICAHLRQCYPQGTCGSAAQLEYMIEQCNPG